MEATNQKPSEPSDVVDEPNEHQAAVIENDNSATKPTEVIEDDTSKDDEQAGTSSECVLETGSEKPTAKRNYRRRTGNSDDDSSSADETNELAPAGENMDAVQPQESSESEDVSLDDLHVSASDDQNNQNARR